MKKKILLLLVITAFATACGKVPKLTNGEDAIVTFKDSKLSISANDLYNELKDKYALAALVDMIDLKILNEEYPNEAEKAAAYVKSEMDSLKANSYFAGDNGKYDESKFLSYISQTYGLSTTEAFEDLINLGYYRNLAIEAYAKDQITEKQIKDYYNKETVGDIEASHILIGVNVSSDATAAEKKTAEEAALKKAKDIIKELNDGAVFAELAKKYSTDSSNASKGGELGYFNKGQMEDSFEKAAYELKKGSYSKEPVKTTYGYHIILKTDAKEKPSLDDSKEKILKDLSTKLISDDATTSVNAMIELRKSYGFKIEDSNVNSNYSKLINNQIINAQNQNNE